MSEPLGRNLFRQPNFGPKRLMLSVDEEPISRALGYQFQIARRAGDIPRAMTFQRFSEIRLHGADPYLNSQGDR